MSFDHGRRDWIRVATLGAGVVMVPRALSAAEPEEVTPVEDLMREHGVLRRVLLVYDEVLRRFAANEPVPPQTLPEAAGLVRRFVEDYHERLEEEHVFPRFERAGKLTELVAVLRVQHQRGRAITEQVLRLGEKASSPEQRRALTEALRGFIRMYEAHAAREDTVLFPALRGLVGDKAYAALGERFEEKERSLFGNGGFEKMVAEVAKLEQGGGLADLAKLTPKA